MLALQDSIVFTCFTTSLIFYEYFLTLDVEVQQYWSRKPTGASFFFFLNRYVSIANRIVVLIGLSSRWSNTSCTVILWFQELVTLVGLVVLVFIAATRVYAVWSGNLAVFVVILSVGLVLPIATLYLRGTADLASLPPSVLGTTCADRGEAATPTAGEFLFVANVLAGVDDILVLVFTWKKTYEIYRAAARVRIKANIPSLLLRDGTLYFVIKAIVHPIAIVLNRQAGGNADLTALSAIILSRFMLNLRQVCYGNDSTLSNFDTEDSRSIVMDMGGPLFDSSAGSSDSSESSESSDLEMHRVRVGESVVSAA